MLYNPVVDLAQITNNSIIIYKYNTHPSIRSIKQIEAEKNLSRGKYNGYMSKKTISKITSRLTAWIESSYKIINNYNSSSYLKRPLITFVTLTLSSEQVHSDNVIKRKLFIPFVQLLIAKYNVMHYFWRAEAQKNGNIHFHIIVDSYINHKTLRDEWNLAQEKLGYISIFEKKFKHRQPNSTDIHSLKNIRNPSAYVCKYVCKTDGYRKIEGRIHGSSDSIRLIKTFEIVADKMVEDYVNKAIELKLATVYYSDNFTLIEINNKKHMERLAPELYKLKDNYLIACANFLYSKNKETFYNLLYGI